MEGIKGKSYHQIVTCGEVDVRMERTRNLINRSRIFNDKEYFIRLWNSTLAEPLSGKVKVLGLVD